jgi:hypothetical protein
MGRADTTTTAAYRARSRSCLSQGNSFLSVSVVPRETFRNLPRDSVRMTYSSTKYSDIEYVNKFKKKKKKEIIRYGDNGRVSKG